jgi:hypothetical protein
VIKGDKLPTAGLMAGATFGAEFASMFIVLFMACIAVARRAFVDIVNVAFFASNLSVDPFEFECGKVVVEFSGLPAIGGMAGRAVRPEPAFVRFIFLMAGCAICGRFRKISECPRTGVTLRAY